MIFLPPNIPLIARLTQEGLDAQSYYDAPSKTLKIGLLNLMPLKEETEYHFATILSNYSLPIELYFLKLKTHISKNTSTDYLNQYYFPIQQKINQMDLLILTGAPVEELPFEKVGYWEELKEHFETIKALSKPMISICWSAQAALNYFYGITKILIPKKSFGVFENKIIHQDNNILSNLTDTIAMPVSRHSDIIKTEVENNKKLKIILESEEVGVFLVKDLEHPFFYITGHPEYSANILKNEYQRDLEKGRKDVDTPYNYDLKNPICFWKKNATQLYHNLIKILTDKN